jgi:hypothetical protein
VGARRAQLGDMVMIACESCKKTFTRTAISPSTRIGSPREDMHWTADIQRLLVTLLTPPYVRHPCVWPSSLRCVPARPCTTPHRLFPLPAGVTRRFAREGPPGKAYFALQSENIVKIVQTSTPPQNRKPLTIRKKCLPVAGGISRSLLGWIGNPEPRELPRECGDTI